MIPRIGEVITKLFEGEVIKTENSWDGKTILIVAKDKEGNLLSYSIKKE